MNLRLSLPKIADDSNIIYSLPYNINKKVQKVNGHCAVTEKEIQIYLDDKLVECHPLDEFDELICEQLIGCSMLVGKNSSGTQFLCAFTQTQFIRYAELCKVIEFYKRTGNIITDTGEDEPACPKCGLPYDGSTTCPFCAKKSQVFIRLIKRAAPYKWKFFAALSCTIITELLWILMPYLQKIVVDDYIVPAKSDLTGFFGICGVMAGLMFVAWGLEHVNMKTSFIVALGVGRDLRQEVFAKAQKLSMASISKRTAGELINRISNDAMKLQDFVTANGKDAIVKLFSIIVLAAMLLVLNIKLALFVLMPIPIVVFIMIKVYNVVGIRYNRVWRFHTHYSSLLHDILNGIRVVKSYGNEKNEVEKYTKASKNWMKSAISADMVWYLAVPPTWFLMSIGNLFVLYFGGEMFLGHTLSLGELMQYTTYVAMIYGPLEWMIQIPRLLADTSVSASRVFEILDEVTDVKDKTTAVNVDIKGDIRFDNVYFGYKVYSPVLKGINCEIKQGEMIGVVGHSGVGKSTMINLILRLYDCTQGKVLIDGVDIKDISQESLRSQVGVVLQETFLFDGSVFDNIRYAKPDASFEEIIRSAKIANAHDFIVKLPDGYNTRVGDKGYSLSGGERQRIAIARAILHNPKILILDEATASLDTQTEKSIQDALGRLIKGRTTIAIAHRLSTLSHADKLIVLDKGKLAEMGTHDELMRNEGVYYKLVMAQRQTTKMKKIKEAV